MRKHDCDKGLGVHNYSTFYHRLLKEWRGEPITFVEIGNNKWGVSLPAWKDYFTRARIVGADVMPIKTEDERLKTYVADQRAPESLHRMMETVGLVDVILDDAIHDFDYNWQLVEIMMEYLKPGGIYIVEDLTIRTRDMFRERLEEMKTRYRLESADILEIPYIRHDNNDNRILVMKKKMADPKEEDIAVVVMAASQKEFKTLIEIICSLIVRKIRFRKVIVYDLGLDPSTLFLLREMFPIQHIDIRTPDHIGKIAKTDWRPMILEEVMIADMKETERMIWLDSTVGGVTMEDWSSYNHPFIVECKSGTTIRSIINQETMDYFSITPSDILLDKPQLDTSRLGIHVNQDTMDLITEWSSIAQSTRGVELTAVLDILYYRIVKAL
jgi:SAM-dependent methyltransferase